MSNFQDIPEKFNFSENEEIILQYWKDIDAFKTSLKLSEGRPEFTFYDGPPFATGLPHYGHILAGTIKDTVTRYAHQTGHYVSRRFGWDCHGLPVEYEIDKKLGITGRDMVLEMGVANYNGECRSIVQRYTAEWEETVTRLGRWIDFRNDYKTMDPSFMESVWWVFKTMFDKGLVYRGYKVMPYSTACGTPLSNFEAGLNYKDVNDPAVVVSFPLINDPEVSLLAWTTTPWTLPSNLALCVNSSFDYIKIQDKTRNNKIFIILEKRLSQLFPEINKPDCTDERKEELYTILEHLKGSQLVGLKYTPLFDYFINQPNAFRVVSDNYVTEEGGTGIVHQAPAFGEDDYRVCLSNNIIGKGEDLPCPVDANGRYTDQVPEYVGRAVKEADNDICQALKAKGRLVMKEVYFHSYPFCWRSDTPLIYKAVPSWFVSVEKVKPQLLNNNTQTYWVPSFVQEKRFHNWLADAKDWAISRNRFWGTPIPLWISDDLEEMIAIGSVDELYQLSGVKVTDLHKEYVDNITIPSKQGKGLLRRVDEVFDCWFESGSMPYAQLHYPFENQDRFNNGYPADFIAEGLDQTRGWFYTLMVISTCLFNKPAFKNLIVNGLVLAADGKKMSKRLKNYPDPKLILKNCGADALRLYLINSPVVRAEVLKFQEEGVSDIIRGVLIPWYNVFRFNFQSIDRYENELKTKFIYNPTLYLEKLTNDSDIWIIGASKSLVKFVHEEMTAYRLYTVVPKLLSFIEELSNWYVRLNRDRMKGLYNNDEALISLNVLTNVLITMTLIMSPFTPFFSEYLYQHLRRLFTNTSNDAIDSFGKSDSIHYLMLPSTPLDNEINTVAVKRFQILQEVVTIVRIARERRRIRNNLPLKNIIIVSSNPVDIEALNYLRSYVLLEVNSWDMTLSIEFDKMCVLKVQPNFKDLGKRLGKDMKNVAKAINDLTHNQIVDFMNTGSINILGYDLNTEHLVIKKEFNGDNKKYEAGISDDGRLLVAIDTTCDEEVLEELKARAIASAIQKLRKSGGLVMTDRIEIFYDELNSSSSAASSLIAKAVAKHANATIKRVKTLPLPLELKSKHAIVIAKETINDNDISKSPFSLVLTQPIVAVNSNLVKQLIESSSVSSSTIPIDITVDSAVSYIQTMDYDKVIGLDSIDLVIDEIKFTVVKNVHYFSSTLDLLLKGNDDAIKQKYPYLPNVDSLVG